MRKARIKEVQAMGSSDPLCPSLSSLQPSIAHLHLIDKEIHHRAEFVGKDHITAVIQTITTRQAHHIGHTTECSGKDKREIVNLLITAERASMQTIRRLRINHTILTKNDEMARKPTKKKGGGEFVFANTLHRTPSPTQFCEAVILKYRYFVALVPSLSNPDPKFE